jgi:uncharacterized protein YjbI with pentapeptide repeats
MGMLLIGVDLTRTNLSAANLKWANLQDAHLKETIYDQATIWPDGFNASWAGAIKMQART